MSPATHPGSLAESGDAYLPGGPRRFSLIGKLTVSLLAGLGIIVSAEVGLRAFWYYGREPYRPSLEPIGVQYGDLWPNEDKILEVLPELPYRWTTNSQGLRDRREFAVPRPPGVVRILCVGDSITFGPFLEGHECYPAWLEKRLGGVLGDRVEVINAGVQGYTICDQYAYLSQRGRLLEPDLVVLQLCSNDLQGLSPDLQAIFCRGGPYCCRSGPPPLTPHLRQRWIGKHLALARAAKDLRDALSLRSALAEAPAFDPQAAKTFEWDYLFTSRYAQQRTKDEGRYAEIFEEFVELTDELGVPVVCLLSPLLQRVRDQGLSAHVEEFFEALCRRHGVPLAHPLEEFRRVGDAEALYLLPHDGHLSRYGCWMLAQAAAEPILRCLGIEEEIDLRPGR